MRNTGQMNQLRLIEMNHNGIDSAALDRWITGNYGEDQYKDQEICEECPLADDADCGKCPSECLAEAKDAALSEQADRERDARLCGD